MPSGRSSWNTRIRRLIFVYLVPCYILVTLFGQHEVVESNTYWDWDKVIAGAISGPTTRKHAIFYNLFVPKHPQSNNAVRILREQIDAVKDSYAYKTDPTLTVYFVTLGQEDVVTNDLLKEVCGPNLACYLAKHFAKGRETVTLTRMHEFCINNPNAIISYIHNKGSFHNTQDNENWRPILTEAALSDMCIAHLDDDQCNSCGLNFYASWTPFFVRLLIRYTYMICNVLSTWNLKTHTLFASNIARKHVLGHLLLCTKVGAPSRVFGQNECSNRKDGHATIKRTDY
jgi:hypothetical protein